MTLSFDGTNKIIEITDTNYIKIIDIYSDWKEWAQQNPQFVKAFRTFGGDPTVSGQYAPRYINLENSRKIKISNLSITIEGNLYTEDGSSPFINESSNITHKTSDASTVATSGSSMTPADVWNYDTRTLTDSGALTQEEHDKLMASLTKKQYIYLK